MNHFVNAFCVLLVGAAAMAGSTSVFARDILLCIDEIEGESAVRDPRGCIDVQSWSWSLDRPGDSSGSTRTRGSVEVGDLVIVKEVDKSSPDLLIGMLQGKVFKTATLLVRACPAGCDTTPLPLVTITLDNVTFTRLDMGGTAGTRPTESLSMGFEAVEYCYQQLDDKGSAGDEICRQYSIDTGA